MKLRVLLALFVLGAVACGQDRRAADDLRGEERDSAGIRIVENPRPPEGSRLGWRIGPERVVLIGVLEGEEPYMLHNVVDATKLPAGRLDRRLVFSRRRDFHLRFRRELRSLPFP